ncbi:MAG: flagellar basal body P-ring formation protein FlgA [Acidobacteria bacterium]|nr:flagellar basal body P-ring formation protein FlgA [Acidobacteriota bacterium]
MHPLVPLVLLLVLAAVTVSAEPASVTLEEKVAAALRVEIGTRLGPGAVVSIEQVQVTVRERATGSMAVVPAPHATLGLIPFVVVGAGPQGRPVQVGRGTAHAVVTVPYATAARTLPRGHLLTAADLVDVVGNPGPMPLRRLPLSRDLVGGTTRQDIVAGAIVTHQSATQPPAVRVGDPVKAIAAVGTVQITAELVALDNGVEGAIVRVVNRESKRELRARVLATGVVEVIHE